MWEKYWANLHWKSENKSKWTSKLTSNTQKIRIFGLSWWNKRLWRNCLRERKIEKVLHNQEIFVPTSWKKPLFPSKIGTNFQMFNSRMAMRYKSCFMQNKSAKPSLTESCTRKKTVDNRYLASLWKKLRKQIMKCAPSIDILKNSTNSGSRNALLQFVNSFLCPNQICIRDRLRWTSREWTESVSPVWCKILFGRNSLWCLERNCNLVYSLTKNIRRPWTRY